MNDSEVRVLLELLNIYGALARAEEQFEHDQNGFLVCIKAWQRLLGLGLVAWFDAKKQRWCVAVNDGSYV